jgi:predicted CxxxxCH...CXXCH cytochrome family protein
MRHATPSRPALLAALVASVLLAACGSSRMVNGTVDGGCTSCHGAPPADRGHQIHAAAAGVASYGDTRFTADYLAPATTTYAFGCGNCHPLDLSAHAVHTGGSPSPVAILDLSPVGAPAGSLRARNDPAASYDAGLKTCAGVYCHSTGQEAPAFVDSPAWDGPAVPGPARCAGCHGNPPNYPSGAAGSATANGHVALRTEGPADFAVGHFGGLPSVDHEGSAHGGGTGTQFAGDSAAPITCQTCHYRTADPANTGPSGFYYLDTSGTYGVGPAYAGVFVDCIACHDGGGTSPAQGVGSAMPYFHVNGKRDVDFDPRTSLTVSAGMTLPSGADLPTRPYWYTRATTNKDGGPITWVADSVAASTVAGIDGTTLSLQIRDASWDATTKTCSNVACHLNAAARTAVQSIQWGEPPGSCAICHGN